MPRAIPEFYLHSRPGSGNLHFEQLTWPAPPPSITANPDARQQAFDLAARMRAMWK
ncbi:hypothetical protein [Candidatus Accumulibacter sp. ACC003]|uniref:hypothetical protein n=1 Tax=Candidatus Accumulibacter sp. ACC003 TaxID=2823334 RepID=UPI0025C37EA4|nr:hypothetical protein [Candidatus Accumulibacter sp. ACC003]